MPREKPTAWTAFFLAIAALCAPFAGAHAGDSGKRHVVEIRAFEFVPKTIHLSPGDVVVWTNHDLVPHTVTADNEAWDSGLLDTGESWEWITDEPIGDIATYFCRYHPGMRGAIKATQAIE